MQHYLFDRYDLEMLESLRRSAFYEGDAFYCNPKDYNVTEEECAEYLRALVNACEQNKECNKKREEKWDAAIEGADIISFFIIYVLASIAFLVYRIFFVGITGWLEIPTIFAVILFPCFILSKIIQLIVLFISPIFNKYTFHREFFPDENKNVENLFEEYLWKKELYEMAESKGEKEKQVAYHLIERLSHPKLDDFLEVIEKELKEPSEEYIFGDLKYGMSPTEIYQTKVFKGTSSAETNEGFELGYRESYLYRFFEFCSNNHPHIHFILEDNSLKKVDMICEFDLWNWNNSKEIDMISKCFFSCCKILSQYYAPPINLEKHRLTSQDLPFLTHTQWTDLESYGRVPQDKAIFCVGKKLVVLSVDIDKDKSGRSYPYKITMKIEFSKSESINNQSLNTDWLNTLNINLDDLYHINLDYLLHRKYGYPGDSRIRRR